MGITTLAALPPWATGLIVVGAAVVVFILVKAGKGRKPGR
jgi:hypothetical protein